MVNIVDRVSGIGSFSKEIFFLRIFFQISQILIIFHISAKIQIPFFHLNFFMTFEIFFMILSAQNVLLQTSLRIKSASIYILGTVSFVILTMIS